MRICFKTKTVALGIGEFSAFTDRPTASGGTGGGGFWRAQIGRMWHDELRERLEKQEPEAAFEVKVAARWPHGKWIFELQGRADQVIEREESLAIREIKTTRQPLPAHEPDLRERYPDYFLQLEAYRRLYPIALPDAADKRITAELVFVEIETGMMQTVPLPPEGDDGFTRQLDRIHAFLERRRDQLERLRDFSFHPPFPQPRPGQESIREELENAFADRKIGLFQAPTGFGKTGAVLEFALNRLRRGRVDRLLFLTGKATGQIQAAAQLERMLAGQPTVSFLQVRNKSEHCIHTEFHCFPEVCPFLANLEQRWDENGLARLFAESGRRIDLEFVRDAGRRAGICPYEITRSILPHLDIWIGDYNYVFSPANRGLFFNQPGFDPAHTLLVVDEAHNLPARVRDAFSARVTFQAALDTMTQLEFLGVRPALLSAWERWLDFLSSLPACDELSPHAEEELRRMVARVCDQLAARPLDYPGLGPAITQQLTDMFAIRQLLESDQLERLLWSPENGRLHLSCIDAGPFIAETLRGFGQSILMSATLAPLETFRQNCRLDFTETAFHEAAAPWRKRACEVAVDLRVDTRFHARSTHYATTAATVAALVEKSPTPVVVFFASYRYAETIRQRLDDDFPWTKIAMQERGLDFRQQAEFVEESLLLSDALFLILGGSYAESIDLLGGRVACAMVVGPALPEVNAVQKARLKRLPDLRRDEAFQAVYQVPGMQRVSQAIGRLVRAPEHRAKILLHCQRFADKSYSHLLHPDHRPTTFLFSSDDLAAWLDA